MIQTLTDVFVGRRLHQMAVCLVLGGCLLSVGVAGAAEVGQQAAPNQEQIEYTKNAPRVVNDVLAVKSIVYRDVTVDSGPGLDLSGMGF